MSSTLTQFAILVAIIYAASVSAAPKSCDELRIAGETGIRKMIFVDTNSKLPKTEEEFAVYCEEGKKMLRGLYSYKKCMKGALAQEAMNTASDAIKEVLKSYCGAQGRKKSLAVLKCAADDSVEKSRKCTSETLNVLEYLGSPNIGTKDMLPQICCMSHMTKECVRKHIRSICDNVDVTGHFDKIMHAISKDVLEIACSDYKSLAACEQKIPAQMKKLRTIAAKPSPDLSQRQFVATVVKIGEKITD